eukprot:1859485-Rhodomonas_salina.1
MLLRCSYELSGTDSGSAARHAILLCLPYAMSGTEVGHAGTGAVDGAVSQGRRRWAPHRARR